MAAAARAQLGFCNGSKGDPIFLEDFGSGSGNGPQLPAGTTSYTYTTGVIEDGFYSIMSSTAMNGSSHNSIDHTPDDGNGRLFLVNASFTAGEFYRREVSGLCVNTTFEFTAWVMNVYNAASGSCGGTGIPVDVTFEIWDASETTLLKSGSTGAIDGSATPQWRQFGLVFTTPPGQTSVVLKMKNNGEGGCGNDLAIDDIMFRSCGDTATLTVDGNTGNTFRACADQTPLSVTIEVTVDSGAPHAFQWQESADGEIWTDIPGENGSTLTASGLTADRFYRVKVAEDAANLSNPFCFTLSDAFAVDIVALPDAPIVENNPVILCGNDTVPALVAEVETGQSVRWFDAPSGGVPLFEGASYETEVAGTYYAEAYYEGSGCSGTSRTAVSLQLLEAPRIPGYETETISFCEKDSHILDAGLDGVQYDWQPGGGTQRTFRVTASGTYILTITAANGCTDVKTFEMTAVPIPEIASIVFKDRTVTIEAVPPGDYQYAIGGDGFQDENVFTNVKGGLHTVTVREKNQCGQASQDYFLLVVPAYFTPNGDGFNDLFEIGGFEHIPGTTVDIFDRHGKLICRLDGQRDSWNGTLGGAPLPSDDYWFRLRSPDGSLRTGHFSLIR